MNNLITRSLSGIIYVAAIVVCVLAGKWSLMGLTIILCIAGIIEFDHLGLKKSLDKGRSLLTCIDIVGGATLITATVIYLTNGSYVLFAIYMLLIMARLIAQLYIKDEESAANTTHSLAAQLWIAAPLALLNVIESYSPHITLFMFIFIWLNDTGAYIVGSTMGRKRLFPRISPKKSWEGFWGGAVFCLVAALVISWCFGKYTAGLDKGAIIAIAELSVVFATFGDLIESSIKRNLHVKDFGNIIPGHGGILDRIDSLLCVAPGILAYLIFIGII